MGELIYKEESYQVMGACFEVYKHMGPGFLEAVYQECLEIELTERGIPFSRNRKLALRLKDKILVKTYTADFVSFDKIMLEVKAVSELINDHRAQLINYLKATGVRLGVLVNFGSQRQLEYERMVI